MKRGIGIREMPTVRCINCIHAMRSTAPMWMCAKLDGWRTPLLDRKCPEYKHLNAAQTRESK